MRIPCNKHTYDATLVFNIETRKYEYLPFVIEGRLSHTIYIIPINLPYGFSWREGKLLVRGTPTGGIYTLGWLMERDEKGWIIDRDGSISVLHPSVIEVGIHSVEDKYGIWKPSLNNACRFTGSITWIDVYTYERSIERYVGFLSMMDTYFPLPKSN